MTKVSVLMPIYNTHPEHLRDAIDSILRQTFTDFEFLILNDSPDNTELDDIVGSYSDPRIIYAKNERNIGISASRNKLIDMSRGEYLAVFDHDDISMPKRLEKEVVYLNQNPYIGVVSVQCKTWYQSNRKGYISHYPTENIKIKQTFTTENLFSHSGCIIRKSVLTEHNIRYEQQYSPSEDYRLWACLMGVTDFHVIDEVLLTVRYHQNNTSTKYAKVMRTATDAIVSQIRDKHPYLYELYKKDQQIQICHLPFLEIKKSNNKTKIYLLGVIPLLKLKKENNKTKIYLLGFIPLLHIKTKLSKTSRGIENDLREQKAFSQPLPYQYIPMDNLYKTSINNGNKVCFVSFGDSRMIESKERLTQQAIAIGTFDEIYIMDERNLSLDFMNKFQDKLVHGNRGFGYWCWKSGAVKQVMDKMQDGDILLYTDIGCHLNPTRKQEMQGLINSVKVSKSGILGFAIHKTEKHWNKGGVLDYFNVRNRRDITDSNQICATAFFLRKNAVTENLIKEWFGIFENHFDLADDTPSKSPNLDGFREHRHDQSIWSILAKLNNADIANYKLPTRHKGNKKGPCPILALRDKK